MRDFFESKQFLVVGNWKMNGSRQQLLDFAKASAGKDTAGCRRVLCLPSVLVPTGVEAFADTLVQVGGQDCHHEKSGAYTGDVAASMLADAGATWVIVGHSERRQGHGETNEIVREKAVAALNAGLTPIICVGEKAHDREAGRHLDVIISQVKASVPATAPGQAMAIAYEPVWAIGTGLSATEAQVCEAHDAIAGWQNAHRQPLPVLYGGSVKQDTSSALACLDNVDGFLIGGASLDPSSFARIAQLSSSALT